jgi:hypothetical protein
MTESNRTAVAQIGCKDLDCRCQPVLQCPGDGSNWHIRLWAIPRGRSFPLSYDPEDTGIGHSSLPGHVESTFVPAAKRL